MKHAVRISILMFGLVGAYLTVVVPQVLAPDGGPIMVCPPGSKDPRCAGVGSL
jgi:hypothetical protein